MVEKLVCEECGEEYDYYMFDNYELNLCPSCYDEYSEKGFIKRDYHCDDVTHRVTCPMCGKVYHFEIVDSECETIGCSVNFFWLQDDGCIFARWKEKN